LQATNFEQVIATQNKQLHQKTQLLGTQTAEIKKLQCEKQCVLDKIKQLGNQVQVQELQGQLHEAVQEASMLRQVAQTHGKETALLKAQATALRMKLNEADAENARLGSACTAAQSKADVRF